MLLLPLLPSTVDSSSYFFFLLFSFFASCYHLHITLTAIKSSQRSYVILGSVRKLYAAVGKVFDVNKYD